MPVLPRRYRVRLGPQAASGFPGSLLYSEQARIPKILPIDPGHPLADLLYIHIGRANEDAPHHAPVAVYILLLDSNVLAEDHVRKRLFGALAEGLGLLRRIDLSEAYSDLRAALHEYGDCVAVGDAYDAAFVHRTGIGLDRKEPSDHRQAERQSARPSFPSIGPPHRLTRLRSMQRFVEHPRLLRPKQTAHPQNYQGRHPVG
jgi:hypothetical protein